MRNLNDVVVGTQNFRYYEFVKSATAIRKGIDNTPNEGQWQCIEALAANTLQPTRDVFGAINVLSGFRSILLCYAVGSDANSNHTRGEVADIEPFNNSIRLIDMAVWMHDNLEFRELICEYFPWGWIHIAYRKGGNIKKVKLKDENHHYTRVNMDYIKSIYA